MIGQLIGNGRKLNLKDRIIEISQKYNLTHLGSNLSAADILDEIVPLGEVVVSSGHAGIAYFCALEKHFGMNAEKLFKMHGIHAPMMGSLGHGIGIALGKAIARPKEKIYCLISDGECMEGSVWESLRLARELKAWNLNIYVNANGYGGMGPINLDVLNNQLRATGFPVNVVYTNMKPLPKELSAHYATTSAIP